MPEMAGSPTLKPPRQMGLRSDTRLSLPPNTTGGFLSGAPLQCLSYKATVRLFILGLAPITHSKDWGFWISPPLGVSQEGEQDH